MMLRITFYAGESMLLAAILWTLMLPIFGFARKLKIIPPLSSLNLLIYAWLLLFIVNSLCSEWFGPDFTALYHAAIWLSPISLLALLAGKRYQTITDTAIENADRESNQ